MPRLSDVDEALLQPPRAPTDIYSAHKKAKGEWVFEELAHPKAWIEIDDQHVYSLEGRE